MVAKIPGLAWGRCLAQNLDDGNHFPLVLWDLPGIQVDPASVEEASVLVEHQVIQAASPYQEASVVTLKDPAYQVWVHETCLQEAL